MDLLSHPLIAIVLLIGLLVFFHEMGHFLVGKACGIAVEVFSIGFGPVILSWSRRETNYRISLLPLGGYVKFYGALPSETVPPEVKGREFHRAHVGKRIATVAAGPLANFLLAIATFAGMGWVGIPLPPPVVGEIMEGSPAAKAGLQFMDRIRSINDVAIETWRDVQTQIVGAPGRPLHLEVERDGQRLKIEVVPSAVDDPDGLTQKPRGQIGIAPSFIPATLTLTDPLGVAAGVGLKTGDYVEALIVNGEKTPIRYWRQLESALRRIWADPAVTEIVWTVKPVIYKADGNDFGPERSVAMSLSGVRVLDREPWEQIGITHAQLTIAAIDDTSLTALLQPGDQIIQWGDVAVKDAFQYRDAVMAKQAPSMEVTVLRQGKPLTQTIPLKSHDVQKAGGKEIFHSLPVSFLGAMESPEPVIEQYRNPLKAIAYGVRETLDKTVLIGSMVAGLFTGDMPLGALGGPIAVAKVASDSVKMGWMAFFGSLAMISINLGLLNLFPIPVLDGGQLLLLFTEGVRRRPLPEIVVENYQKIGFVMILAVLVLATYNDLSRFWASMLKGFSGFVNG